MGYGEAGGGGSVQWMVFHKNPKQKPGLPEVVHYHDTDKSTDEVAPGQRIITIVVKGGVCRQVDGLNVIDVHLIDDPELIRIFWPPYNVPLPAAVLPIPAI